MRHLVVDTFADALFAGNPAGVVPLAALPDDATMQRVAHRIGAPTTAFVVPEEPGEYAVRWYTPSKEMPLCGHATIAAARYLFGLEENEARTTLRFVWPGGVLVTERVGDLVSIDLPAAEVVPVPPPPGLLEALRTDAVSCAVSSDDVLVELASYDAVADVAPDFVALAEQPFRGIVVTAPGPEGVDFVSRAFFPAFGVDEDQVCVSAHGKLAPYWAARLGRDRLEAVQQSDRGGRLVVEHRGERVRVLGAAVSRGGIRELTPEPV